LSDVGEENGVILIKD